MVVDVLRVRFKIYFKSRTERICCWFVCAVLDKELSYWVSPPGECRALYGNGNTRGKAS